MQEILEKTGFSYSGIHDIIHNEPEKTLLLLQAINQEYLEAKEKMAIMEKELERLRSNKGLLVSSFLHAHKALKLGDSPLCFLTEDSAVVIKRMEENKMDYESYRITPLPDQL